MSLNRGITSTVGAVGRDAAKHQKAEAGGMPSARIMVLCSPHPSSLLRLSTLVSLQDTWIQWALSPVDPATGFEAPTPFMQLGARINLLFQARTPGPQAIITDIHPASLHGPEKQAESGLGEAQPTPPSHLMGLTISPCAYNLALLRLFKCKDECIFLSSS